MDLLEKYKKAWDNQPEETNKVSKIDIYKMAQSKSSSIVKWIFIIGVLELIFWTALNLNFTGEYSEMYKQLHLINLVAWTTYLHYTAIILFLFLFYKNYKAVSIMDGTKSLIEKILKVRKTVKYYVYFNLAFSALSTVVVLLFMFSDMDLLMQYYENNNIKVGDKNSLIISLIITLIIGLGLMLLLLWLFYKLIYGSLLRKLNKNYKELAKLEEL